MDHWTDFVPYFLMAIKLIALAVAGYFAIKWHFDQDKKLKEQAQKDENVKNS